MEASSQGVFFVTRQKKKNDFLTTALSFFFVFCFDHQSFAKLPKTPEAYLQRLFDVLHTPEHYPANPDHFALCFHVAKLSLI